MAFPQPPQHEMHLPSVVIDVEDLPSSAPSSPTLPDNAHDAVLVRTFDQLANPKLWPPFEEQRPLLAFFAETVHRWRGWPGRVSLSIVTSQAAACEAAPGRPSPVDVVAVARDPKDAQIVVTLDRINGREETTMYLLAPGEETPCQFTSLGHSPGRFLPAVVTGLAHLGYLKPTMDGLRNDRFDLARRLRAGWVDWLRHAPGAPSLPPALTSLSWVEAPRLVSVPFPTRKRPADRRDPGAPHKGSASRAGDRTVAAPEDVGAPPEVRAPGGKPAPQRQQLSGLSLLCGIDLTDPCPPAVIEALNQPLTVTPAMRQRVHELADQLRANVPSEPLTQVLLHHLPRLPARFFEGFVPSDVCCQTADVLHLFMCDDTAAPRPTRWILRGHNEFDFSLGQPSRSRGRRVRSGIDGLLAAGVGKPLLDRAALRTLRAQLADVMEANTAFSYLCDLLYQRFPQHQDRDQLLRQCLRGDRPTLAGLQLLTAGEAPLPGVTAEQLKELLQPDLLTAGKFRQVLFHRGISILEGSRYLCHWGLSKAGRELLNLPAAPLRHHSSAQHQTETAQLRFVHQTMRDLSLYLGVEPNSVRHCINAEGNGADAAFHALVASSMLHLPVNH